MPRTYFHAAEHFGTAQAHGQRLYCSPSDETLHTFYQVNNLTPQASVIPGRVLLIPSLDGSTDASMGQGRLIAERADHTARNGLTPVDASRFNGNFSLLRAVSDAGDAADPYVGLFESADYLGKRLDGIRDGFRSLNAHYVDALRRRVPLNAPDVIAGRRIIEANLKQSLRGFERGVLKRPHARSIKDMLGISHKALQNSVRTTGTSKEVKQIGDALTRTGKLTKLVGRVALVGDVIEIGTGLSKVTDTFTSQGAQAGSAMLATEAGKLAGGMAGAAIGAKAAVSGATAALLVFGAGTGGTGLVVIGVAMVGGAFLGDWVGEFVGENAAKGAIVVVDEAVLRGMNWYFRFD